MSAVAYRFLEPLDVLFLRGNKLFGDPGSFGDSLIPPWPSVAAGALRSRILADDGVDLAAFARGEIDHPALGTPMEPGPFAVTGFHVARRWASGQVELLITPPADLVISEDDRKPSAVRAIVPLSWPGGKPSSAAGLASSFILPRLPVLAERERGKPASGYWLTQAGWARYLRGEVPAVGELVSSHELWQFDHRVGVGLDAATRRAADGRLFTVQAVAMKAGVGFLAVVVGADLPSNGTVRLGGDGRAAAVQSVDFSPPQSDYESIAKARRCRLVLTTPGIFAKGWLPTGARENDKRDDGAVCFDLHGVKGWIVSAAVPRFEFVSGWDLAKWQPKPALRAAPAGSVWWLELDEGITAEALRKLVERGLWTDEQYDEEMRRAEGFNRVALAVWK
ncbi:MULTISPECIES: type III-B CRISPR module-associated protein Cmr3 [Methylococcus]|uniref:Type III-B CRISPR module-associated protein Cmr3 n=1 Tax=Methylococcus capsulatus TaxID=414 RepID=A0ABZ2F4C9_METCP|nr:MULTISPECIES: type III-B CRISPR module-associated protein Cmr3 [Methylococcus]MDF9391731.1 type III-B CRISPR module-associated protein Cmr3 [Methylococcus capsulatus]